MKKLLLVFSAATMVACSTKCGPVAPVVGVRITGGTHYGLVRQDKGEDKLSLVFYSKESQTTYHVHNVVNPGRSDGIAHVLVVGVDSEGVKSYYEASRGIDGAVVGSIAGEPINYFKERPGKEEEIKGAAVRGLAVFGGISGAQIPTAGSGACVP